MLIVDFVGVIKVGVVIVEVIFEVIFVIVEFRIV